MLARFERPVWSRRRDSVGTTWKRDQVMPRKYCWLTDKGRAGERRMEAMSRPHARALDLPGWPCPPRVRDIPDHEESWGWVFVTSLAQDELGYLWIDGSATPRFCRLDESRQNPGAIACWTEQGLGIWVHPKSMSYLGPVSRLDMDDDRWMPVAVALSELPHFVNKAGT